MSALEVEKKGRVAKQASYKLASISSEIKNSALKNMADALDKNRDSIIRSNQKDLKIGTKKGLSVALLDRLAINNARIDSMIEGLLSVAALKDPVGEVLSETSRPNGLQIKKVRVPLGVIGIIYEARPNVTVDSAALCLKSGNAVLLRGGSDAINSNKVLSKIISGAACAAGVPAGSIQLIENTSRETAKALMQARQYVDVLIPRGGKGLIQAVIKEACIPVIETGEGNCHAYVEKSADLKMAVEIVYNAKVSRPSVCNAIETLLVDEEISNEFLPLVKARLDQANVELRGDSKTRKILKGIKAASEKDWGTEYLSLILAVKVVSGIDEAITHINKYGTRHSETIITRDASAAKEFSKKIDSAAVYTNASTRFTDGGEFGFGAEIGISTQKLHARGPMGLSELTSYKYVVAGRGQIRV